MNENGLLKSFRKKNRSPLLFFFVSLRTGMSKVHPVQISTALPAQVIKATICRPISTFSELRFFFIVFG